MEPAEAGLDPERLRRIDRHFARYVDDGRLPGWLVTVARHGRLAHVAWGGMGDVEAGLPVQADTLWRIYSMTKPVTSVAAMMLYEEGALELSDLVSAYIPAFAGVRVDAMYRAAGFEWSTPAAMDLAQACDIWAGLPLLFQPGAEWNYSVATDVLGRVIEVVSGTRLDEFLATRILGPLGMSGSGFHVSDGDAGRLAALYTPGRDGRPTRLDALGSAARTPPSMISGGADRFLLHAAAPFQRPPDPAAAAPARLSGIGRLSHSRARRHGRRLAVRARPVTARPVTARPYHACEGSCGQGSGVGTLMIDMQGSRSGGDGLDERGSR